MRFFKTPVLKQLIISQSAFQFLFWVLLNVSSLVFKVQSDDWMNCRRANCMHSHSIPNLLSSLRNCGFVASYCLFVWVRLCPSCQINFEERACIVLDVLVAIILEMKDSCDMTPCSLVVGCYHFEGAYCFGRTDGAEGPSETMVTSTKLHGLPSQDVV